MKTYDTSAQKAATAGLVHIPVTFTEPQGFVVPIQKIAGGGGSKPPAGPPTGLLQPDAHKPPIGDIQLSAASGLPERIFVNFDQTFAVIKPGGKNAETFLAISDMIGESMLAERKGLDLFQVPEYVMTLVYNAKNRGAVPAFLQPLMVQAEEEGEMLANHHLPLWAYYGIASRAHNLMWFNPCPHGGKKLNLSLSYSSKPNWDENGRLNCSRKSDDEIREVLAAGRRILSCPELNMDSGRARYRVRQRELDARQRCRNRWKRRQDEAPPGERE